MTPIDILLFCMQCDRQRTRTPGAALLVCVPNSMCSLYGATILTHMCTTRLLTGPAAAAMHWVPSVVFCMQLWRL